MVSLRHLLAFLSAASIGVCFGAEVARYVPSQSPSPMLIDISGHGHHAFGDISVGNGAGKLFWQSQSDLGVVLPSEIHEAFVATQAYTLCMWVRDWPTTVENNLFIFSTYTNKPVGGLTFEVYGRAHLVHTDGNFYFDSWQRNVFADMPTGADRAKWMHLCMASDFNDGSKSTAVFIDGKIITTVVSAPTALIIADISTAAGPAVRPDMYNMARLVLSGQGFSGELADVRIFDEALDAAAVGDVYVEVAPSPPANDPTVRLLSGETPLESVDTVRVVSSQNWYVQSGSFADRSAESLDVDNAELLVKQDIDVNYTRNSFLQWQIEADTVRRFLASPKTKATLRLRGFASNSRINPLTSVRVFETEPWSSETGDMTWNTQPAKVVSYGVRSAPDGNDDWQRFWWYDAGTPWPVTETNSLGYVYGHCGQEDAYCFQRLPSRLDEDDTELLAVDSAGTTYKWAFDSSIDTAHKGWQIFTDATAEFGYSSSNCGAVWPVQTLAGGAPSKNSDCVMFREQNGVKSLLFDDDLCDCRSVLSFGHSMCFGGATGVADAFGVDLLSNPSEACGAGASVPQTTNGLELFYRTRSNSIHEPFRSDIFSGAAPDAQHNNTGLMTVDLTTWLRQQLANTGSQQSIHLGLYPNPDRLENRIFSLHSLRSPTDFWRPMIEFDVVPSIDDGQHLCGPPRSVPRAQFAPQAANLAAWKAPSALPDNDTVAIDGWIVNDGSGVQANHAFGSETIQGVTMDFVEISHDAVSQLAFRYDGVDGRNFVVNQDQKMQAHMKFRVLTETQITSMGFLVPFAWNQSSDAVTGMAIFLSYSSTEIVLGFHHSNHPNPEDQSAPVAQFTLPEGRSLNDGQYHTLDMVLDGPNQRVTAFLDGRAILALDRTDLQALAVSWPATTPYTRWGDLYTSPDMPVLHVAEFSVFEHTGIAVPSSCASVVPLTGRQFTFTMQCTDDGVWTDTATQSALNQCIEPSSPCDISLNGGPVSASRAPLCTADGWRLSDDEWLDVSAATVGDFGTGDFRASFDFKSDGNVQVGGEGSGNLMIRSSELVEPYSGLTFFGRDDGSITVRQALSTPMTTGFDCLDCQNDWQNWHTYVVEQRHGTLSLWIDGALKDSAVVDPAPAQFVTNAPLRFGANHENDLRQNVNGWMRNIRLDDEPFTLSCAADLRKARTASPTTMARWCQARHF